MTIDLLESAARTLGSLVEQVVFVGGASVNLWITDPGAPPPRPTKDVDVVVEVTTLAALAAFQGRLRDRGFKEDIESGVICRWQYATTESPDPLVLDAMPAEARLLGFENRWQTAALPHAGRVELPSRTAIRAITPPYLLATKLEAFGGRGRGDHLGSRDLEDLILLVDGREELVPEVLTSDTQVRAFLAAEIGALMQQPRFVDAVYGFLRGDPASQSRAESIVLPRLLAIAGAT